MAKIMIIAGGMWQCPIVQLVKRKGHYVICTNLYEDSPAFQYADVGIVADVLDKEKNLQIAMEYKPDAVLTEQTDIAVPTVAYIAEQLGIKGIGFEIARRFTNKYETRKYIYDAGFISPEFALCRNIDEAKRFLREVPVSIIKPLDSQSSRGIHVVRSVDDIEKNFEDCIQYSNEEKAIVIEEYIEGTEFTVDGLKTSTEYIVTAISEKEHYAHNPNIANRLLFTQKNDRFDYEKLKKLNEDMVIAMQLPFGLTHAEYKYKNGEFYLIEIAARGGGTKISSDIVPLVSGINSNEIYLDILTGGKGEVVREPYHECAVLGFFDFKPGKVISIKGVDEAKKQLGVHDIGLEIKVGDILGQAQDDRSRCGYYILWGDSVEELNQREKLLKETVEVWTK
ncbi:ATP-grasp domain-containing protein [bacterium 0.1xD8-71]|nr:ATP-grasp domain-containing protein [bacterium 0.1xD8-71]